MPKIKIVVLCLVGFALTGCGIAPLSSVQSESTTVSFDQWECTKQGNTFDEYKTSMDTVVRVYQCDQYTRKEKTNDR